MKRRRGQAIQRVRAEMADWGRPIDDVTDAELEEGLTRTGEVARQFGLTTDSVVAFSRAIAGTGGTTETALRNIELLYSPRTEEG